MVMARLYEDIKIYPTLHPDSHIFQDYKMDGIIMVVYAVNTRSI
jgi:hypothetical protein